MSLLSKIKKGNADLPARIVIAGPEGIGKSAYASLAPNPLFIAAEDGLTGLEHLERFTPTTLEELKKLLDEVEGSKSLGYETLVIDTADWLERTIHASLCRAHNVRSIEEYGKGYGKGYVAAATELTSLLAQLDNIRHKQRMGIVVLSHVQIRTHTPPGSDPYDRYEMKGHKQFTGLLREWPDACLFMVYETFTTKDKGNDKVVGGERIMRTNWAPGWDAKNRYNLPDPIRVNRERGFAELLTDIAKYRNTPKLQLTDAELREKIRTLAPLASFPEEGDSKAKFDALYAQLDTLPHASLTAILARLEELVG